MRDASVHSCCSELRCPSLSGRGALAGLRLRAAPECPALRWASGPARLLCRLQHATAPSTLAGRWRGLWSRRPSPWSAVFSPSQGHYRTEGRC